MIMISTLGIFATMVVLVLLIRKGNICNDGVWALFWLGICVIGASAILEGHLKQKTGQTWQLACINKNGTIAKKKYGEYYYDTCEFK